MSHYEPIGRCEIDFKVSRREHATSCPREPSKGLRKFRSTTMQRFMAMKKLVEEGQVRSSSRFEGSMALPGELGNFLILLGNSNVNGFLGRGLKPSAGREPAPPMERSRGELCFEDARRSPDLY